MDNYKRFLQELLFVYNDEHPQQALRRRIQAALDERWQDALLIPSEVTVEQWGKYGSDIGEYSGLLSETTTSSSEGAASKDRSGFPWD